MDGAFVSFRELRKLRKVYEVVVNGRKTRGAIVATLNDMQRYSRKNQAQ
jgi:hypothetical protein